MRVQRAAAGGRGHGRAGPPVARLYRGPDVLEDLRGEGGWRAARARDGRPRPAPATPAALDRSTSGCETHPRTCAPARLWAALPPTHAAQPRGQPERGAQPRTCRSAWLWRARNWRSSSMGTSPLSTVCGGWPRGGGMETRRTVFTGAGERQGGGWGRTAAGRSWRRLRCAALRQPRTAAVGARKRPAAPPTTPARKARQGASGRALNSASRLANGEAASAAAAPAAASVSICSPSAAGGAAAPSAGAAGASWSSRALTCGARVVGRSAERLAGKLSWGLEALACRGAGFDPLGHGGLQLGDHRPTAHTGEDSRPPPPDSAHLEHEGLQLGVHQVKGHLVGQQRFVVGPAAVTTTAEDATDECVGNRADGHSGPPRQAPRRRPPAAWRAPGALRAGGRRLTPAGAPGWRPPRRRRPAA